MAPEKKEHNNDLRNLVIHHYQNGDSQREIPTKTLLLRTTVQYMIEKYKSTKCRGNLFGRGRRRETTATTDRLIQRKVKLDRRKSASAVKVEIENELGISLHDDTIRNRAHEARLFGRVDRKKPYVNKINRGKRLKFVKEMLERLSSVLFGRTSENSTFLAPMVWSTSGEEFDPKCTVPTVKHAGGSVMVWGCFTRRRVGKLIISWIDSTTETFWNKIFDHQSTILNSGNNPTSCMIMIVNIPLG